MAAAKINFKNSEQNYSILAQGKKDISTSKQGDPFYLKQLNTKIREADFNSSGQWRGDAEGVPGRDAPGGQPAGTWPISAEMWLCPLPSSVSSCSCIVLEIGPETEVPKILPETGFPPLHPGGTVQVCEHNGDMAEWKPADFPPIGEIFEQITVPPRHHEKTQSDGHIPYSYYAPRPGKGTGLGGGKKDSLFPKRRQRRFLPPSLPDLASGFISAKSFERKLNLNGLKAENGRCQGKISSGEKKEHKRGDA